MTTTATATDMPQPPSTTNPARPGQDPSASTVKKGHIGRVVVGSIVAGFVGALVLTVGPLAGAEEHVITGSVLLAFAAAWAALAVLSTRRTDQPQRWARIPAAAMTGAGLTILLLAPTGNELGWVWPAALIGLVAWMVVHARRQLGSRTRALLL